MKYLLYKTWLLALLLIVGGGSLWADEVTWIASEAGYANGDEVGDVTVNSYISFTFSKGTNNNFVPRYYTTGTAVRCYGGNAINVKGTSVTVTQIKFTFSTGEGTNTISANVGEFSSPYWSGSADDITFTVNGTTGQRRIASITVSYTPSGSPIPDPIKYNVNIDNEIIGGAVTADPISAVAGTAISLTANPNDGYEFASWNVTNASTGEAIEVSDNEFTMPEANVNVSATFRELTGASGCLVFGRNGLMINSVSVTGDDNLGNAWTITTIGTTSFSHQQLFSQVGSENRPATSITFSMALPAKVNVVAFSAKFGGYTDTAGEVTLTVGKATVGTGRLNATEDVTISSTNTAVGNVLTVTVTNIAKGVKCFGVSYTYERIPSPVFTPQIQSFVAQDADEKYFATFSNADDVFMAEGAIVYAVTVEGSRLSLNSNVFEADEVEIDGDVVRGSWIPANTGALLESPGKSVTFYAVANKYLDSQEADNLLRPASVPMETDGSYLFYKLAYGNVEDASTLGFWWGAADGGAYTAKAGAYLAVPKALEANLINGFSFGDDDATGIRTVESAGMPADGKYLRDGRLVIVRAGHEYDVLGIRK